MAMNSVVPKSDYDMMEIKINNSIPKDVEVFAGSSSVQVQRFYVNAVNQAHNNNGFYHRNAGGHGHANNRLQQNYHDNQFDNINHVRQNNIHHDIENKVDEVNGGLQIGFGNLNIGGNMGARNEHYINHFVANNMDHFNRNAGRNINANLHQQANAHQNHHDNQIAIRNVNGHFNQNNMGAVLNYDIKNVSSNIISGNGGEGTIFIPIQKKFPAAFIKIRIVGTNIISSPITIPREQNQISIIGDGRSIPSVRFDPLWTSDKGHREALTYLKKRGVSQLSCDKMYREGLTDPTKWKLNEQELRNLKLPKGTINIINDWSDKHEKFMKLDLNKIDSFIPGLRLFGKENFAYVAGYRAYHKEFANNKDIDNGKVVVWEQYKMPGLSDEKSKSAKKLFAELVHKSKDASWIRQQMINKYGKGWNVFRLAKNSKKYFTYASNCYFKSDDWICFR